MLYFVLRFSLQQERRAKASAQAKREAPTRKTSAQAKREAPTRKTSASKKAGASKKAHVD